MPLQGAQMRFSPFESDVSNCYQQTRRKKQREVVIIVLEVMTLISVHPLKPIILLLSLLPLLNGDNNLTYSDISTVLVTPVGGTPIAISSNNYAYKITGTPAKWIWSGDGNKPGCPINITIRVSWTVICLVQPTTVSVISDNYSNATIDGHLFESTSWKKSTSYSFTPTTQCNGIYTFDLWSRNDPKFGSVCGDGPAGVCYAVTQPVCCPNTGAFFVPASCSCTPCNLVMPYCLNCSGPTVCLVCDTSQNYVLQSGACVYQQSSKLFVKAVLKAPYKNEITIVVGIRPVQLNLTKLNFSQVFQPDLPLTNSTFSYDVNGTVSLTYQYYSTLEGTTSTFVFDPKSSLLPEFTNVYSTSLDVLLEDNANTPITYYSNDLYNYAQILEKVELSLIYVSYIILIASAACNKIIGVELFGVWQVAHLTLANINKINPIMYPLTLSQLSSGYNWAFSSDRRQVPDRINALGFVGDMSANFNVMLLVLSLPLLVGGVMYLLSKAVKKHSQRVKEISGRLLKEWLLAVAVFCSLSIGFSLGLQANYGAGTAINLLVSFVSITMMLSVLAGSVSLGGEGYGEFWISFKSDPIHKSYFGIILVYRLTLGFLIGVLNESDTGPIFPFFASVGVLVYQMSNNPFRKSMHNYRAFTLQAATVLLLMLTMYYRSMKKNSPIVQVSRILVPGILQIAVLAMCFLVSLGFLIYQLLLKFYFRGECLKSRVSNVERLHPEEVVECRLNDLDGVL